MTAPCRPSPVPQPHPVAAPGRELHRRQVAGAPHGSVLAQPEPRHRQAHLGDPEVGGRGHRTRPGRHARSQGEVGRRLHDPTCRGPQPDGRSESEGDAGAVVGQGKLFEMGEAPLEISAAPGGCMRPAPRSRTRLRGTRAATARRGSASSCRCSSRTAPPTRCGTREHQHPRPDVSTLRKDVVLRPHPFAWSPSDARFPGNRCSDGARTGSTPVRGARRWIRPAGVGARCEPGAVLTWSAITVCAARSRGRRQPSRGREVLFAMFRDGTFYDPAACPIGLTKPMGHPPHDGRSRLGPTAKGVAGTGIRRPVVLRDGVRTGSAGEPEIRPEGIAARSCGGGCASPSADCAQTGAGSGRPALFVAGRRRGLLRQAPDARTNGSPGRRAHHATAPSAVGSAQRTN